MIPKIWVTSLDRFSRKMPRFLSINRANALTQKVNDRYSTCGKPFSVILVPNVIFLRITPPMKGFTVMVYPCPLSGHAENLAKRGTQKPQFRKMCVRMSDILLCRYRYNVMLCRLRIMFSYVQALVCVFVCGKQYHGRCVCCFGCKRSNVSSGIRLELCSKQLLCG